MSTVLAAEGMGMNAEQFWNLILITVPTVILAVVTVWSNDRLTKMVLTAVLALAPKRKRRRKVTVAPVVNVEVQVHGKHEAPDDETHHGFTFNANRVEETWDKALENMTKGIMPAVWPERHHE